jgi:hypothetical protein
MSDEKTETTEEAGVERAPTDEGLDSGGVEAILEYDPFGPEEGPPVEGGAPAEAASKEEAPEKAPAEAAPEEAPEEPLAEEPQGVEVQEPEETPREKLLREHNEMLMGQLQKLTQTQPASGEKPQAPKEEPFPGYDYSVRKEVVDAIASGEPEQIAAAINAISQGVSQRVHGELRQEYRGHMKQAIDGYVRSQLKASEDEQTIVTDFYGTYPQFDTPARRAAVVQIASTIFTPGTRWNAEMRDKIAKAAAQELNINLQAATHEGGSSAAAEPAAVPKKSSGNSKPEQKRGGPRQVGVASRPSPGPVASQAEDIEDTLFGHD